MEEYISLLSEHYEYGNTINSNSSSGSSSSSGGNSNNIEMIRPSKVDKIFASRACRKSVMFGDPLTLPNMERIVKNLYILDHPWNCPHGRATMRALANLSFQ